MSSEREVRKEKDFWGNEREVVYENDRKIGEIKSEERGGFLGIGAESVRAEYDSDGRERSYTRQEERGGFLGIGSEPVEVRYDTSDVEVSHSRVEERGGFMGVGSHHVRVEYDNSGSEISQSNTERRGDFLGIGGERVKVTRYSEQSKDNSASSSALSRRIDALSDQTAPGSISPPRVGVADTNSRGAIIGVCIFFLGVIGLNRVLNQVEQAPIYAAELVTPSSIGPVHLGMSLAEAKAAMSGSKFERTSDAAGVALVAVSSGEGELFVLYAGEQDPNSEIDWDADITNMATFNSSYRTAEGLHPGATVADAERVLGGVVEVVRSEIESREYIFFERQPPGMDFRLNYTGIFSANSRVTTKFHPSAEIYAIEIY